MKSLKPVFAFACLFMSFFPAGAQETYSKVKIYAPKDQTERASLIGLLQIDHFNYSSDGAIVTEISRSDISRLKTTKYKFRVLVPDLKKQLDEENRKYFGALKKGHQNRVAMEQPGSTINSIIPTPSAFEVKSTFGGYYSFAEMETAINALVAAYPAIASKTSIGKTAEDRDLWLIKISDNVATDELNEPEVLYLGLQHAREAITGASMIFFMQYLCENYATDTRIKNLVDNREIYIVPCFNPDGWEYNRLNGGAGSMWRKNRSKIDSSKRGHSWDYEYGVDLNRNWGVDWADCDAPILGYASSCGSGSALSSEETYWGDSAFSEKETQAVRDFAKTRHLAAGFDQHAYGPYYSLPFGRKSLGHTMSGKGQNFYTAIPGLMGTYNGMRAADSYDALGYEVAGGFKDWMLMGEIGVGTKDTVWAMTGEGAAGGGTSGNNFWAPAGQIVNLCKGMCYQNLQLAFAAGTYVDIQDANNMSVSASSGTLNFILKRLGLGNDPVTVTFIPLENIQAAAAASVTVSGMPGYYDTVNRGISYTLPAGISNGKRIRYIWKVEAGGYTYSDTVVKFYNPLTLVSDNMEGSFATNLTAVSNVADNWAFTSLAAFAGSQSMTESPAGNYTASTTRTVTYKNVLDLSSNTAAYLSFWIKHRAENFRDRLQVQVSTNSTDGTDGTWTPIAGSTTIQEPGTLDGATLNGQPAFTGIRDYWTREIFDLSAYNSSNFRFRFVFTSDNDPSSFKFEKDDGFYIDDLSVVKSTANLVALPVKFLNFRAALLPSHAVRLNWEATIDQEHDHFEIERSTDGFDFRYIGREAGPGPYQFIDAKAINGYNYYRIRQVDKNGNVSYSKIVNIYIKPGYVVNLYPNPVNDVLFINPGVNQPEKVRIELRDLQGRLVYVRDQLVNSNTSLLPVDMKGWRSQVYILQITNSKGEIITTKKVSKL